MSPLFGEITKCGILGFSVQGFGVNVWLFVLKFSGPDFPKAALAGM